MEVLIDTSYLIRLERTSRTVDATDTMVAGVAAVTVAELWHGVHRADSEQRREARRANVEGSLARVTVLSYDVEVAQIHALIWADLHRRGAVIGPHDLQIAATALHHDLPILTLNVREFARVPGIKLVEL